MHILHHKLWLLLHITPQHCLLLTWVEKDDNMWKYLIAPLLNILKIKDKLHFTTLNYTPNYTLHFTP